VKAVAEFGVDLPRVVVVKSAKRQAVIEFYAAVGNIQRSNRNAVFLEEAFPER
jgi:hypothetical protein